MKKKLKKRIGQQLVESLQGFVEALESGVDIEKTFTCHHVKVNIDSMECEPQTVKQTRKMLRASQTVFAKFLGVSVQTVRAWEQGANVPSDIAKRFMYEIRLNPDYWTTRLRARIVLKKHAAAS